MPNSSATTTPRARVVVACAVLLAAPSGWAQTQEHAQIAAAFTDVRLRTPEGGGGLEGPASDAQGAVYFTDRTNDRILKLGTDGKISTFRQPANRPNGLAFDAQFRLIAAEQGSTPQSPKRVTRTDLKTGKIDVLAERYEGASFGTPNDVTVDGHGRIFFTAGGAVYRIDPDGRLVRVVAPPVVEGCNGLIVSLDDRTLYVGESNNTPQGPRRIRAFELSPDGTASNPRIFHTFFPNRGADGMAMDLDGNIYVTAGLDRIRDNPAELLDGMAGVFVFSPAGVLIRHVHTSIGYPTNIAFGGPDMKTAYVTTGKTLFKFSTKVAGTHR